MHWIWQWISLYSDIHIQVHIPGKWNESCLFIYQLFHQVKDGWKKINLSLLCLVACINLIWYKNMSLCNMAWLQVCMSMSGVSVWRLISRAGMLHWSHSSVCSLVLGLQFNKSLTVGLHNLEKKSKLQFIRSKLRFKM